MNQLELLNVWITVLDNDYLTPCLVCLFIMHLFQAMNYSMLDTVVEKLLYMSCMCVMILHISGINYSLLRRDDRSCLMLNFTRICRSSFLFLCFRPLSVGGLVFSGANVQAASVVLNEFVSTKADIKRQLAPLKNLNLEKGRRTIGFMFACIGRGLNHYCEENVESQVFREFFPETPLFGLFGNGEIGRENLTLMEDTKSYKLPEVNHGYTTVVVLISIK